jgi:hypothetical protein
MKVFVPHPKDKNIYFDEIINYSDFEYVFDEYQEFNADFKLVNIQFPEAIFNWRTPSKEELIDLENWFLEVKVTAKIIYTMNDVKTHYSSDLMYNHLFKLIHKYADAVVHLGKYSLERYREKFSETSIHTVIYHPIYASLLRNFNTSDIQEYLPFELKDKYVVSSIGSIRSKEEMNKVVSFFNKIPIKDKVLIVPRMNIFRKVPSFIPYRFRKYYVKIVDFYNFYSIRNEIYYLDNKFLEYPFLVDLVEKSSLLIVPRIKSLNSGNLFLGITFNKDLVIPSVGNLSEVMNLLKIPNFNFKKITRKSVKNFIHLIEKVKYYEQSDYLAKKNRFHPKFIANEQDIFFKSIINQ